MKTSPFFCLILGALALSAPAQEAVKTVMRILPDGSTRTTVSNPDERTSEEIISEPNGKVIRKTVFTMNEQNIATGATHFDAKGAVRYKEAYTLDASGRLQESRLFSRDGRPLGRRVFTYDAKNQPRVEDFDARGNPVAAPTKARKTR